MTRDHRKPSSEQRQALSPEQVRRATFERAIKLLTMRSRSVAELRERLLRARNTSSSVVDEVIGRLKEHGYLDDQQFAVAFASSKIRQQPVGRQRVKRDLALKKVDQAVADEALDRVFTEWSEALLLEQAIEKRIRLRGRPRSRAEAKKLFDHLLRRGFPFELVAEKIRHVMQAENEDYE